MVAAAIELPRSANAWRDCVEDAQCVLIDGLCDKTAVNLAFEQEARDYYKQAARQVDCGVTKFWKPASSKAQCRLQSCSVAAIETKAEGTGK